MKRLLLDSNALIRSLSPANSFGPKTKIMLNNSELFFSPISLFELRLKEMRIPKFKSPVSRALLSSQGMHQLAFDSSAAEHIMSLVTRDPFDMLLVAQAKSTGMLFVTSDIQIHESGLDFAFDLTL